jgi:hypothetical protein
VTSLEQTSSTIKHVYIAKSEFRQDLIVDKLKHAFFKYLLRLSDAVDYGDPLGPIHEAVNRHLGLC